MRIARRRTGARGIYQGIQGRARLIVHPGFGSGYERLGVTGEGSSGDCGAEGQRIGARQSATEGSAVARGRVQRPRLLDAANLPAVDALPDAAWHVAGPPLREAPLN